MRALIIGGAGFVGNYLLAHLKDSMGLETAVTRLPHETLAGKPDREYSLDILCQEDIVKVLEDFAPDYIFHLAAQSSVALSWKNPGLTVDVNIKGSVNVLDAVRQTEKKPRILLIGSGEEYGHILPQETPITEENALRPGNLYAATKACQNMIGKVYANAYGLDIMMVRAFNHVGPGQASQFVVSDFCRQVAQIEKGLKEPVMYTGNLSVKRDFTDVRDVVRAYGLLIQNGERGEVYNIGSGHAVSIEALLNRILSMSSVAIEAKVDPAKLRPVDVPIIEADIAKVTACTGWVPEIPLDQTLLETLEYWRREEEK